jgi:hypothetical protein
VESDAAGNEAGHNCAVRRTWRRFKRRLADLAEQERRARRSAEKAAGLGAESLSLEENVVAQAVALGA